MGNWLLFFVVNICLVYQDCFWDSENRIMNSETRCYEVQGGEKWHYLIGTKMEKRIWLTTI